MAMREMPELTGRLHAQKGGRTYLPPFSYIFLKIEGRTSAMYCRGRRTYFPWHFWDSHCPIHVAKFSSSSLMKASGEPRLRYLWRYSDLLSVIGYTSENGILAASSALRTISCVLTKITAHRKMVSLTSHEKKASGFSDAFLKLKITWNKKPELSHGLHNEIVLIPALPAFPRTLQYHHALSRFHTP